MELALYAPGLGYYSGGATKLGKDGDFTTAPEISPLFGASLAQFAIPLLAQSKPQMMEFCAGSGQLAHDILTELARCGVTLEKYFIVELSGQLRARQQQKLEAFPQVEWLDALPATFDGVIVGNEVLDAMPVQLVQKDADGQGWQEMGVICSTDAEGHSQFGWQTQPASAAIMAQLQAQIPQAESLAPGYLT
ncbi:MAG: SAM-dependent methyltransferase, partial [Burkholderiales bacterium]|nr:SAM-dependent methyltransferase [Burkholderiales bacterium]